MVFHFISSKTLITRKCKKCVLQQAMGNSSSSYNGKSDVHILQQKILECLSWINYMEQEMNQLYRQVVSVICASNEGE